MDSLPDSRTPGFEPGRWQRDVLDQTDVFLPAIEGTKRSSFTFNAWSSPLWWPPGPTIASELPYSPRDLLSRKRYLSGMGTGGTVRELDPSVQVPRHGD
ncbi:hypothetical protein N7513_003281 [Penicillium frequentans]|uniref:Uncharacterized protein n=1 Tax=Penicillium frequentans TaxID=3151616 RepID=A0AAD6CHJ3_9EURO|nr:hypothetical protein N7494_013163 [Penicillium glabrum]KAJ5557695.1 hypothetical protein N7513_003281 [Penicillium glabrum]